MRRREAGFTLVELMVTVAVIAILAAIAIPSFFGETRKTRARAEVTPVFNDIRVRMDQYLQEHGVYPATLGETALHPSAGQEGDPHPLVPLPTTWAPLNLRFSGPDQVFCRYTWVTSQAGTGSGSGSGSGSPVGTTATDVFHFTAPANDWYYLLARCRLDRNHSGFSWYFTSSLDSTIRSDNEGQ